VGRPINNRLIIQCEICGKHNSILNKLVCCGKSLVKVEEPLIETIVVEPIVVKKKKPRYQMNNDLKILILKRDGQRCTKCKSKLCLHIHHIVHRENGGSDDEINLITLCELCHAEEHRGEPIYNLMITRLFRFVAV
jgi:hypothetical protein